MLSTVLIVLGVALSAANAQTICQQLATASHGSVILPSDERYHEVSTENWSATAWGTPNCIVEPASSEDVQKIVALLSNQTIPFAIRSGGHMTSPMAANINDGVLISLSGLKSTEYDSSKQTVTIGAGLRWGEVYYYLDQYEVTAVGARSLGVGVGGLLLGSGLSYLSDLHGLACDNVANFEVVLGNGTIVNANKSSHEQLFRALKGGSNNFGVVTAFTLYTYPIHMVWGGIRAYSSDQLPKLFAALTEYQLSPNKDPYANLMLQPFATNQSSLGAFLNLVYLKPEESPAVFKGFYDIPFLFDTTKIQTITDVIGGLSVPDIPRWDWFTTSFIPSTTIYSKIWSIISGSSELKAIESLTAGSLILGFQPISASVVEAGKAKGQNSLGLSHTNQTWLVLDVGWWNAQDDAVAHNSTNSLLESIESTNKDNGTYLPYKFMNDASWSQSVIPSYGKENVQFLQEVRNTYDPERVFQKLVSGGFKIPDSKQYY